MSAFKGKSTSCAAVSIYHVSNKNVLEVAFTLQYIQKKQCTPLL